MSLNFLKLYGKSFQSKVIIALINDKKFLAQVIDIVDVQQFESDAYQVVIDTIKKYYEQYKSCPTSDVFVKLLSEQTNDVMRVSIKEALMESGKFIEATDLQFVKDEFTNFCINQNIKNAIMKSVNYLEDGQYDKIKIEIDAAMKSGKNKDLGHIYETQVEERIIKNPRKRTIPTEWPVINEIIDGGLGEGDLGCLVGGAGMGKCVGPKTEIEIEYNEIGIEENGIITWYKPWDNVYVNNKMIFAYELDGLAQERP